MATSNTTYRGDVSGILNIWAPMQPQFVLPRLLPEITTDKQEDFFWKRSAGGRLKAPDGTRAPGTTRLRDRTGLTQDTYACVQHSLEAEIPEEHSKKYNQWSIDWINVRAKDKAEELLRAREVRGAAKLINTTTFPLSGSTGVSLSGGTEWDNLSGAVPITVISAGMEAIYARSGVYADTLFLPNQRARLLLSMCTQLRTGLGLNLAPGQEGVVNVSDQILLAALHPALRKLVVGGELYNSTPDSLTPTLTPIWDVDFAALGVTGNGGSIIEPCVGRTICYSEEGGAFMAREYWEDDISSDIVQVQDCTDEKILMPECWYLIGNIKA